MKPRVLLVFALLLSLTACRSAPESIRPTVRDDTTFLGLAVSEASALEDALPRAELYSRIAAAYRDLGDEASMLSLATAALRLAQEAGATDESIRIRLSLAPLLASAGDDASALTALESGLAYAASSSDSALRATVLPLVVQSALQSDEPARPVLRSAVDEVYVIEEPARRAEALIRIAELYQAGGPALSVTGLIQQAIPAIRSTPDAYRRAVLFVRLAELAIASGETRLGNRLFDIIVSDVEGAPPPDAEAQSEQLVNVVESLASFGRAEEALGLVGRFATPGFVARGLIAVAASSDPESVGAELLRRAGELAAEIRDPQSLVETNVVLALAHHRAGNPRVALPYAEAAAGGVVANPSIYSRIDPAGRVVAVLVALDRLQLARDLLARAPDEYVRGVVAVRAAEQLIAESRLGIADDFLTIALVASDEATYLADGLRGQIVGGFARTGSVRLAIRTVERIDDELLRARAVTELAVIAEPAGFVTALYRADLASVLSSR